MLSTGISILLISINVLLNQVSCQFLNSLRPFLGFFFFIGYQDMHLTKIGHSNWLIMLWIINKFEKFISCSYNPELDVMKLNQLQTGSILERSAGKKQSPGRYEDRSYNFFIRKFWILSILNTDRSGLFALHICLDLRKRCWRIWKLSPCIFHLNFTTRNRERTAMKRR